MKHSRAILSALRRITAEHPAVDEIPEGVWTEIAIYDLAHEGRDGKTYLTGDGSALVNRSHGW